MLQNLSSNDKLVILFVVDDNILNLVTCRNTTYIASGDIG